MKQMFPVLAFLFATHSFAGLVDSTKENKINVARIDKTVNLVSKPDLKVNVVVEDLGGSTDVSPTQKLFFTLYSKGEMFNTDATFDLGPVYSVAEIKRLQGGIYSIRAKVPTDDEAMMKDVTIKVDAIKAINDLRKVSCDDFDCEASKNFSSQIKVDVLK